jgi:hypothetical protein
MSMSPAFFAARSSVPAQSRNDQKLMNTKQTQPSFSGGNVNREEKNVFRQAVGKGDINELQKFINSNSPAIVLKELRKALEQEGAHAIQAKEKGEFLQREYEENQRKRIAAGLERPSDMRSPWSH